MPISVSSRTVRAPALIGAAVVGVDQLTKHWAVNALDDGRTIDVVWTLRLKLAFNKGMAFSSGERFGPYVPVVAAVVIVVVLLATAGRPRTRWSVVAAGLVVGGAAGNVVDRIARNGGGLHGAVVDFIDLQWWPVFNLADVALVVGGALVVLASLRT